MLPLLALVFVAELLGAIDLDWSLGANLAGGLGGLAVLLVAVGAVNITWGRPFLSVPERVGAPELAAFVLVPALLPLIFGGQVTSALVTAAGNLLLLLLVYLVVGYALPAIVREVGVKLAQELAGPSPRSPGPSRCAIGPDVRESWIGSEGDAIWDFTLLGHHVDVTGELLRAAGGIAAISGLYYAIAVLTDATYRERFLDRPGGDMRAVFRDRTAYLELRGRVPSGS